MGNIEISAESDCSPRVVRGPINLPLRVGEKEVAYRLWFFDFADGRWVAALAGGIDEEDRVPLRIESACLFGHVFHSAKCDCRFQLDEAFRRIAELKKGLIVYAIDQDARGLGIDAHFRIYELRQQQNLDTEAVYKELQAPVDARSYAPVSFILRYLKIHKLLLLSNNLTRQRFLLDEGFDVTMEALEARLDLHNMSTLMLEKEDLGYTWSFRTHGDWLAPLQARVLDDIEKQGAQLVFATRDLVGEHLGTEWNAARELEKILGYTSGHLKEQTSELVVYLTDYPRIDEVRIYARMGASFIVVPFAKIPSWLITAGAGAGIRIQDWERKNQYRVSRPQWQLIHQTLDFDVYGRGDAVRYVFPNATEDVDSNVIWIEQLHQLISEIAPGYEGRVSGRSTHSCAWIETGVLNEPNISLLQGFGFEIQETSVKSLERTGILLGLDMETLRTTSSELWNTFQQIRSKNTAVASFSMDSNDKNNT